MSEEKPSLGKHLCARCEEVKERHRHQESFQGTGWHPEDPSSPQRQKKTPLSERPVAFQDDDRVHLAGEDAERVLKALADFAADPPGDGPEDRRAAALGRVAGEYARKDGNVTVLTLPSSKWNDACHALAQQGVEVCLSDAHPRQPRKKS